MLCLALSAGTASAGAIRSFPGFQPASLAKGDDVSSAAVALGFNLNFLGSSANSVFVDSNGVITFGSPYVGYPGNPPGEELAGGIIRPLSTSTQPLITPFLTDVDTSDPAAGTVTYGTATLSGRPVFVVNYTNVTYVNFTGDNFDAKRNSFQIVLIDRSDTGTGNFDIEFNYDKIQWEASDSNGGANGLGGYTALAGYTNGSGLPGTYYSLPGSGIPGSFLDGFPASLIVGSQNSGFPGRYVFEIRNGVTPVITSLNPSSVMAGGPSFALSVNGSGFAPSSAVLWNGTAIPAAYVSNSQLTATIVPGLIAGTGNASVTVITGGVSSASAPIAINPPPAISSLSPSSSQAGSFGFTLTLNGSGFTNGSTALWNGAPLPTAFVNSTQITAVVPANVVASQGTASITVRTGTLESDASPFTITPLSSLTSLSPATTLAGSGDFTLTVNGSNFVTNSTVFWNGEALPTTLVSGSQLTASVSAGLVSSQKSVTITVSAGVIPSNGLGFTIGAAPAISSLTPATAIAGGPGFSLTLSGSNFASNSTASWNGSPLATTFVNPMQLTVQVPAELIGAAAAANVTVTTAAIVSNSLPFTILHGPTITSLDPQTTIAGSANFILTVNGADFPNNATIVWNGSAVSTVFVNATQLTAAIPRELIAAAQVVNVTVTTGVLSSNASPFDIAAPPTITGLNPSSIVEGSPAFTLTVAGSGFTPGAAIVWKGTPLPAEFAGVNQLTASIPASLIDTPQSASVAVAAGGVVSNAVAMTVTPLPPSTITHLTPSTVPAATGGFSLTLDGSDFTPNSTVLWNGSALATNFAGANRLTAVVPAALIAIPGSVAISVTNIRSGSNSVSFTVSIPDPVITALSPPAVQAIGPDFTLTVTGSGFLDSQILWDGVAIPTTFVNGNQLTAFIPAGMITTPATPVISVRNGPKVSNAAPFVITLAAPISTISPSSVPTGSSTFVLTVAGANFMTTSTVLWNGVALFTTYVSPGQLTATVPSDRLATPGNVVVTVRTRRNESNALTFRIN